MTKVAISESLQKALKDYLFNNPNAELVNTYLFFIEKQFGLHPVLSVKDKMIYQSSEDAVKRLEAEGKIWHEAEIKISLGQASVNEQTTKIYICPFTGKVFGDNTHPNPQDAIYDWVSKCPENKERVGGLKSKRFFVSEDPEVISNYAAKVKKKEPITKVVYSSVLNGKLFNSKQAVVEDFKKNYLKEMSVFEVQNQNRFQIEEHFLGFIQKYLNEEKISQFVESLSDLPDFAEHINQWVESD